MSWQGGISTDHARLQIMAFSAPQKKSYLACYPRLICPNRQLNRAHVGTNATPTLVLLVPGLDDWRCQEKMKN
jgi:hypothetical protein